MALQFNRTDTSTGHQWTVYARLDTGTTQLQDGMILTLNLYDSVGAAEQGLNPVMAPDVITFTASELNATNPGFVAALGAAVQAGQVNSPVDALRTAMYTLIKTKPGYESAIDV